MKVTVLITLLDDPRVARTLAGLQDQMRAPDAILVADGGSRPPTLDAVRPFLTDPRVRFEPLPGSVAATRNAALAKVDGDVLVFLDADETAPRGWLAALLAPIERGEADATGGATRPHGPPLSAAERYVDGFEAWFYDRVVATDPTTIPMGNSAWRLDLLRRIGGFDPRLAWGGEDWDVNLRAAKAGARLRFVPEAWVHHDQSHLSSYPRLLRRKYRYSVGATVAYLKNDALKGRAGRAAKVSASYPHALEWANLALKPVAFVHGWAAWRRMRR